MNTAPDPTGRARTRPLSQLPIGVLFDLDTDEATDAIATRGHAFHEAGHVWAAWRTGLTLGTASIHDELAPYETSSIDLTDWLAAMGWLTQGLAVAADVCAELGEPFDGHMTSDVQQMWEHVLDVRQGPCCCRRSPGQEPDKRARHLLKDKQWMSGQVGDVISDWPLIEALAVRLMEVGRLSGPQARHALETAPRRLTQPGNARQHCGGRKST